MDSGTNIDCYEELAELRKEIIEDFNIIKSYNDSVIQNNLMLIDTDLYADPVTILEIIKKNNEKLNSINTLIKKIID